MIRPILALLCALAIGWLAPGDAEAKRKKRRVKAAPTKAERPAARPEPARPSPTGGETTAQPTSQPPERPAATSAAPPPQDVKIADRIEFDERAVGGQTARPGTVRLFERRDSELRSMVRTRRALRGAIVRSVLGTPPAREEK